MAQARFVVVVGGRWPWHWRLFRDCRASHQCLSPRPSPAPLAAAALLCARGPGSLPSAVPFGPHLPPAAVAVAAPQALQVSTAAPQAERQVVVAAVALPQSSLVALVVP